MTTIELYDTTLRDGMQGEGMSLSAHEKLRVAHKLDELGIDVIEAGFPSSNPKELELFGLLAGEEFHHAQIAAFGMTRRRDLGVVKRCRCWPTASPRSRRSSERPGRYISRRWSRSAGRRTWR
jgi:isopropylmalate/homocitrate/citramalate synthase